MCFWSEYAFFNCDGTTQRQKHLCSRVPTDPLMAGVEICKNYETPRGCKHSETARPIPHQAPFRHVCNRDAPARSGSQTKWTPTIKDPFSGFVTCSTKEQGQLKDSVRFEWCDGSLCTLEEVYGENDRRFCWGGVDLLELPVEKRTTLLGKGTYDHWVKVWSGGMEKKSDEGKNKG